MSWEKFLAGLTAIVLLIAGIFGAGKAKGRKAERLDRVEEDFEEVKVDAEKELREKQSRPHAARVNSAIERARRRRANSKR